MKGGTGATQNLECDSGPVNGCDADITEEGVSGCTRNPIRSQSPDDCSKNCEDGNDLSVGFLFG